MTRIVGRLWSNWAYFNTFLLDSSGRQPDEEGDNGVIRTHLTCNESDRQDNKSVRVIRNVHETIDVWILRVAAHRDYA